MAENRTARCSCGLLAIDCTGSPEKISVCHCLECQRRTGSAFGIAVFYRRANVHVTGEGTHYVRASDSGFDVDHCFCTNCGSTVFWHPSRKPDLVAVALGCFADPSFGSPHQQVYENHRHAWVGLNL